MIYGSYHYEKCDDGSIVEGIIPEWNPNIEIEIKPESVAQLVCYDKNGEEVYEGDEIESRFGSMRLATFRHYGEIIDGAYTLVK